MSQIKELIYDKQFRGESTKNIREAEPNVYGGSKYGVTIKRSTDFDEIWKKVAEKQFDNLQDPNPFG